MPRRRWVLEMTVQLNRKAVDFAEQLIGDGKCVLDDRDAWSEHQPSASDENAFIEKHGYDEYARWHLGIDEEYAEQTKARYRFPYGDFRRVHRCAVLSAESRAGQRHYPDIELAFAHLHGMLDAAMV
jgi:hypothetical protein